MKAGFLGFPKSGKTYTATLMAIGVRDYFKIPGPIAMFDTEGGSEYVAGMVRKATGTEMLGMKSHSFDALVEMANECVAAGVSVLIVDSMTHVWRELCDARKEEINKARESKGWKPKEKLEFQDWGPLKDIWNRKWTSFYLNSPLHIVICGRAGWDYDMEQNENGRKELVKTGTKMKTESEFGYEPSLLIEMEREKVPNGKGGWKNIRTATVIGDRFNVLDGAVIENPTFQSFLPHVSLLKPASHSTIDTTPKSVTGADETGTDEWAREKRRREILCEEIQGLLLAKFPSRNAEDSKAKADAIFETFNTRSWTKVEGMHSDTLRDGLDRMKAKYETPAPKFDVDELAAQMGDKQ